MFRKGLLGGFAAIAIAFTAFAAQGAPVTFTSRASFNAATTGNTIVTFNGIAPTNNFVTLGGSLTSAGVTFTHTPSVTYLVDGGFDQFYVVGASLGGVLSVQDVNQVLNIALPGAFRAIGFDTKSNYSGTFTVTLSNGEVLTFNNIADTARFFGFTTDSDIVSLSLKGVVGGGSFNLEDFTFGNPSVAAVPEPTSMLLLGTGLLGVAARARKRRKNKAD